MAHYAASSLIYLKKVRPSISRARHLPNTSETEAGIVPAEAAATRSNVLRWCRLLFIIPVVAMLIGKIGKKEGAHTAQIFLGLFVVVVVLAFLLAILLVFLPLAIFNYKSPRRTDVYSSDDEQETDGAVTDQQNVSSSCNQQSTSNSDQHYSDDNHTVLDSMSYPVYISHDLHYLSDESRSSSSESLEGSRRTYPVDDPPPYFRVVINFPMAEVHSNVVREPPSETPPPSYDEVMRNSF